MGKSKGNKVIVRCVGKSAESVTGSMYLIQCETGERILIDAGLYQSNNLLEDYRINNRKFDFKPSEITAVILTHLHIDHTGLVGRLVKEGLQCNIYINYKAVDFLEHMLTDSAKIMARDAVILSKKSSTSVQPIYSQEDVENTLKLVRGVKNGEEIRITDNVSFKLQDAGHVIASSQISVYVKTLSGSIKKVCFSGDLSNTILPQPFCEKFDPIIKCNAFFGECTYNSPDRSVKKEQREKDLEKLESIIRDTCLEKKGKTLLPVFSLQRVETMLYYIWNIFKNDPTFNVPVIIDSPLAIKLLKCYEDNLSGEEGLLFSEMLQWKNLRLVESYEESAALIRDESAKVILSSSGMLTKGRSILHLENILPMKNSHIILCGYQAPNTIGRKIKENKYDEIKINGKYYKNNAGITSLTSFSSHMQYRELQGYYLSLANNGCSTIVLVHSDSNKIEFKKSLEEKISKIGKTTKVIAATKDQVVRI